MSAMDHHESNFRLGLLLAGGGARVRRAVAEAAGAGDLGDALGAAGCGAALGVTAKRLAEREAAALRERLAAGGWNWLVPEDHDFPAHLASTADPPLGLFVRGRLRTAPRVAVVGSRRASPYGRQVARLLGEELGRAGVTVVSGMARGVDAAAHHGALAAAGDSWAVLGCGPDRIYPPEHARLAEDLAESGALITEYPPGTPPRRQNFPERNRIIAGLVSAVVVVEAAARSGALITARLAVEEGREVLAVPGSIFSDLSVGPNTLLRVGAKPLLTLRDLFDVLECDPAPPQPRQPDGLVALVAPAEAVTVDELARRADRSVAEVSAEVLELEMRGELESTADGRYTRLRVAPPERVDGEG